MKKETIGRKINLVLWILQCVIELAMFITLVQIGVLTSKAMAICGGILLVGAVITGLLLGVIPKTRTRFKGIEVIRGIIAYGILVIFSVVCVCGALFIHKADTTLQHISNNSIESLSQKMGVYVLDSSKASTIEDLLDQKFGCPKLPNNQSIPLAVEHIEGEFNTKLTIQEYDAIADAMDALKWGQDAAVILPVSYLDLMSEDPKLEGYLSQIRCIYNCDVNIGNGSDGAAGAAGKAEQAKKEDEHFDITKDPFIVYVSGSDTRNKELVTSRSDVNILVAVNPTTKQIRMINTPRDYYVPNAAGNGELDKLTHCGIYGIQCSMDTLGALYGQDIRYYGQINFSGFEGIIDAIGGIDIYSDEYIELYNLDIQAGWNHLNGKDALNFARERYAFSDGDNARGRHQMQVIQAVILKMTSDPTILSKYSEILDAVQGMFATNLKKEEMTKLIQMQLAEMPQWQIAMYPVVGTGGYNTTYSMPGAELYVMYPDQNSVNEAIRQINEVMGKETAPTAPVDVQPAPETE